MTSTSPQGAKRAPADFIHDAPEAAPGVERSDVRAVNRKVDRDLYATREKIYPRLASGTFRRLKWIVMAVTLGIYYALPWLRWHRGADLPNQAVLVDMESNRYFFFFLEIWPQEFYFVTGLLILAALALFLVTSMAGRVWCGYMCPQTVWTDLMIAVERLWQGDRNARIRLDASPWTVGKVVRKVGTHLTWLLIGLTTGGAFVFYFRDAPTLARELLTGTAPAIAYLFLGLFALTTYVLGGLAREQVCIYMCPWPRIQGAMVDHETLLVSYKGQRGEPRGPHKKGQPWEGRGDCIDCKACVAVCPAGIDIRDGAQLECIQCALCVDACNAIMDKVDRPRGLVAYSTIAREEAEAKGGTAPLRLVRARTLLYAGLSAFVAAVMLAAWLMRTVLEINVISDRNPAYVRLADGGVRNGYTVKVLNKLHEPREFRLAVSGLDGARLTIVGADSGGDTPIRVATDDLREIRILVALPPDKAAALSAPITSYRLVIKDVRSGTETARVVRFHKPEGRAP